MIQVIVRVNTRQDHLLTKEIRHKGQDKPDLHTKYCQQTGLCPFWALYSGHCTRKGNQACFSSTDKKQKVEIPSRSKVTRCSLETKNRHIGLQLKN